jgi:hypothetical protein
MSDIENYFAKIDVMILIRRITEKNLRQVSESEFIIARMVTDKYSFEDKSKKGVLGMVTCYMGVWEIYFTDKSGLFLGEDLHEQIGREMVLGNLEFYTFEINTTT